MEPSDPRCPPVIVCIMQPTYLPWIGYFDLIDQSDTFVFLDTVAFARQSWQQRNRIATPQGPLWLTVPVHRQIGQLISETTVDNTKRWRHKHWASLTANYRRAPFWPRYAPVLEEIYDREWTSLAELDITLITTLCELAGIPAAFERASAMTALRGERTGRLVEICRRLGADTYLSPLGSLGYLEGDTAFASAGIELVFHGYEHPAYAQAGGGFESHLSFLDTLLNMGPDAASTMRGGRRPSARLAQLRAGATLGDGR